MRVDLYSLTAYWSHLRQRMEEGEDVGQLIEQAEGDLSETVDNALAIAAEAERAADALRVEERSIAGRRRTLEARAQRIRAALLAAMDGHGVERIQLDRWTVTARDTPPSVEVFDEAQVPDEYVEHRRDVRKSEVKRAYQQFGECVPGTRVVTGRTLQVRR